MNKHITGLMAGALLSATSLAQEIIIDNIVGPQFSVSGTWSTSTATAGYTGPNYHTHTAGTEYVGHVIMDNGTTGTQSTGSWSASTSTGGYFGTNYQAAPAGSGQSTYTWDIGSVLPQAGSYRLYARWTAGSNRADNAPYTLMLNGVPSSLLVDQKQNGGQWNLLGTYALTPNQASLSLSNQANGYVIADAVQLVPEGASTAHVAWKPQLSQTGWYNVYARWSAFSDRATNAPYTILHADGQSSVLVNQRLNGGQWQLLGNYKLNSSSQIKLSSADTDGHVIADGIRLELTQLDTGSQTYYIHTDHLDTPRVVTNGQNQAVWRSLPTTEPFGDAVPEEDPASTGSNFKFNLRFPGQYFDKETGLAYNYFRDYDPNTGRYVQSDPIGLKGGINTYAYVGGDPISYIDPLGLADIPNPNGTVPGGPWTPAGKGQLPGDFYGPKKESGGRDICRWVPAESEGGPPGSRGYWKTQTPGESWQRFNPEGKPITPEEAHPNRVPQAPPAAGPWPLLIRIGVGLGLFLYSGDAQ